MDGETGLLWEDDLFEGTESNENVNEHEEDDDLIGDLFDTQLTSNEPVQQTQDEENTNEELNALGEFLLHSRGIDPNHISLQDENGNEIAATWDDLTKEEQLQILNEPSETSSVEDELDENEIGLLNLIRLAQMTPEEYIQAQVQRGIAEYAALNQEAPAVQYSVDLLSDDELYLADLASRLPEDTTDEELAEALEVAKQNDALYKKQISGLREEYKQYEDNQREQEEMLTQQQNQEQFAQFSESVLNAIENMNSNQNSLNVQLEQDDMEELAEFILGQDGAGINHFSKALNNPDILVNMAWWALHGNETMDSIASYYENQIKTVAQKQYEKGLAEGKASGTKPAEVVVDKKPRTVNRTYKSVNDLY